MRVGIIRNYLKMLLNNYVQENIVGYGDGFGGSNPVNASKQIVTTTNSHKSLKLH